MIIYTFMDPDTGDEYAYPSLRKAKSARAEIFTRNERPEIMRVTITSPITKDMACRLLMRRGYAELVEDIA